MESLSIITGLIYMEEDHMYSIKLLYLIMLYGATSAVGFLLAFIILAYTFGWFKVLLSIFTNIIGQTFWNSVENISRKIQKI